MKKSDLNKKNLIFLDFFLNHIFSNPDYIAYKQTLPDALDYVLSAIYSLQSFQRYSGTRKQ